MTERGLFPLLLTLAAVGCAAGLPAPTSGDVTRAEQRFPGASAERLARGRTLYVRTCAGCHSLKSPDEVPPDQWAEEIAEMRRDHGVALDDDGASAMTAYLWAVGTRLREARAR
ncbi:MAG: hypothetical protein IT377_10840 [Polyangiaceae bacterium]|nr:hypothetical protein [Polyangiaceae bacterium]